MYHVNTKNVKRVKCIIVVNSTCQIVNAKKVKESKRVSSLLLLYQLCMYCFTLSFALEKLRWVFFFCKIFLYMSTFKNYLAKQLYIYIYIYIYLPLVYKYKNRYTKYKNICKTILLNSFLKIKKNKNKFYNTPKSVYFAKSVL